LCISLGKPKPDDLTDAESAIYDRMEERSESAARRGFIVSFPSSPLIDDEHPPAKRSYVIVAYSGPRDDPAAYILAERDEPDSSGRMFVIDSGPGAGLSRVRYAASFLKFGYWEPYDGPQDVLKNVVPDDLSFYDVDFERHRRPRERRLAEKAQRATVYPDADTMARFMREITLVAAKPDDLTPVESAAWDRLAAEVADITRRGHIVEIPAE
jgi:hypothetical protein